MSTPEQITEAAKRLKRVFVYKEIARSVYAPTRGAGWTNAQEAKQAVKEGLSDDLIMVALAFIEDNDI